MTDESRQSDDELFTSTLRDELAGHSALPYLFLGSGVSRRYLGLPDWSSLLRHFADDIGEDFDFHYATAKRDLPKVASSIAGIFHNVWWHESRYESQRAQYRSIVTDDEAALKVAVADYISKLQTLQPGRPGIDDAKLSHEVSLLRQAVVDGVITTNYDSLTDELFPTFQPYVGQDELMLSDAQFIAETYKIHGSAAEPSSLILTHDDYVEYSKRNHYLAAKLLTIFAEHPVLFIGYSLSDVYIQEILANVATAVGPARIDELARRIYFVEWNEDAAAPAKIESATLVLESGRLPIRRIDAHDYAPILAALTDLERTFPAHVLRELRKHVYDLVAHPEPGQARESVHAIPIDAEGASGLRVVFGVGSFTERDLQDLSSISGRTLRRTDVEQDVLGIRERNLDAANVLSDGIPSGIRPASSSYVPVHKYLSETGRIAEDGEIDFEGLPEVIRELAERRISAADHTISRFERTVRGTLSTPKELMASDHARYFKLESLLCLDPDDYEIEDLRLALVETFEAGEFTTTDRGLFRKALRHYDRLRYRQPKVA